MALPPFYFYLVPVKQRGEKNHIHKNSIAILFTVIPAGRKRPGK
jgi:hypothetical protein